MHAASIGRIADRAGDVGAVRDMTDAGRHGRGGAARRAARRERGIARIARIAVQLVAGEPAQRKRRRVGATEHHRAGAQQVVDDRVVGLGDHVLLQRHAIGGGIAGLVHIDLHRDRHAGQRAGVFAARQPLVQGGGLRQRILGSMIDHGVDAGIDGIEPRQRALRALHGGHFTFADQAGKLSGGQTPKFGHARLLVDGIIGQDGSVNLSAACARPQAAQPAGPRAVRSYSCSNTSTMASATARTRAVRFRSPCITSHRS